MGGCCSIDKPVVISSEENDRLIKKNLKLLSVISMHYADMRNSAMVIKVMNVKWLTKDYYVSLRQERQFLIQNRHDLECNHFEILETTLRREKSELERTKQSLKQIFSLLVHKFFISSGFISDYISAFKADPSKMYAYGSYKKKFLGIKSGNNNFEKLSVQEEDRRILYQICHVTSYIATNKTKRVQYSQISPRNTPRKYYSIRSVSTAAN